jgi:hypothetical protein
MYRIFKYYISMNRFTLYDKTYLLVGRRLVALTAYRVLLTMANMHTYIKYKTHQEYRMQHNTDSLALIRAIHTIVIPNSRRGHIRKDSKDNSG